MKPLLTIAFVLLITTTWAQKDSKWADCDILTSAVCDMCKETIESELIYEKGVKKVTLDVETKNVCVKFDPKKTDKEKIKKAITELGYDADDMPATKEGYENLHECCKKDAHK